MPDLCDRVRTQADATAQASDGCVIRAQEGRRTAALHACDGSHAGWVPHSVHRRNNLFVATLVLLVQILWIALRLPRVHVVAAVADVADATLGV